MNDSQNEASRSASVHLFHCYIDILGSYNLLITLSSNTTKCFIFLEWKTKIRTRKAGRHDRTNLIFLIFVNLLQFWNAYMDCAGSSVWQHYLQRWHPKLRTRECILYNGCLRKIWQINWWFFKERSQGKYLVLQEQLMAPGELKLIKK